MYYDLCNRKLLFDDQTFCFFLLNFAPCEFFITERFGSSRKPTASQTLPARKIHIASKLKRKNKYLYPEDVRACANG